MFLVETRDELFYLKEEIWYNKYHFSVFKNDAIDEMRTFMKQHGITSADEALLQLYQPHEEADEPFSGH
jgi:hypothetical protein